MSLIVSANGGSKFPPIEPGTYLAVCGMVVDIGLQYSETFKNEYFKVLISWELPTETIMIDGEEKPRTIHKIYNFSLNDGTALRQDLAAWRGRDFTAQELEAFDLRNIAGASCYINIIRTERNGRTYSNISSIMALPKGVNRGELSQPPIVFDLDAATYDDVERLPKWIAKMIKESKTYQEKSISPQKMDELNDDGDLPF